MRLLRVNPNYSTTKKSIKMKKILLAFVALCINMIAYSQVTLNFESGANPASIGYDIKEVSIVANPFSAGINTSANVLKVIDNGSAWGGVFHINALPSGDKWSNYQTLKFKIALASDASSSTGKYLELKAGIAANNSDGTQVFSGNATAINATGTWIQMSIPVSYLVNPAYDANPKFYIKYALAALDKAFYIDDVELVPFPATTNASELTFETGANPAVNWYNATPTIESNPYISGINTSSKVLKVVDDGLNQYGGAISINTILPSGENWNNYISIDFKMAVSDAAATKKYLKVVAGVGPNYYDGGTQIFAANANTLSAAGTWYQMSIPINNAVAEAKKSNPFLQLAYGAAGGTYYIDDIVLKKLSTKINPINVVGGFDLRFVNSNECIVTIPESGNAVYSIYNLTGTLMKSSKLKNAKDIISLESITQGVYLITIRGEKNSYSSKFIKY